MLLLIGLASTASSRCSRHIDEGMAGWFDGHAAHTYMRVERAVRSCATQRNNKETRRWTAQGIQGEDLGSISGLTHLVSSEDPSFV